ncbi:MAG: hypothetical protein AB1449_11535 [Chloroflexota bacterium]
MPGLVPGDRVTPTLRRIPRRVCLTLPVLLAACSGIARPAGPGDVLFQDSFEHSSSGWDRYQGDDYRSDYSDGTYQIEVLLPRTDAWSTPGLVFGDVQIEVDARKLGGPDDNLFGVLCRYRDASNFYFFLISSDGYAGIGMREEGTARLLSAETMEPHPAVALGEAVNHLSVRCQGSSLDFSVNGIPVGSVSSSLWPEGDVGLIAGSYEEPGVVIEFDNFSVLQP